jgi:hypothetical protein
MADKKNPGYMEQLREMRALRTQQLRGMTADQRFYANANANHKALLQANQKLAASFDSMSRTFTSSIKGLSSAIGGIASKGVSAAGTAASGAASLAGSITSGLGKVLPFAIAGLVGKMLVWDNLTSDNKNRLTSSVAKLFSSLFGDLPDMFKGIVQRIIKSVSDMDIKFPILSTLMGKAESFVKMVSAGVELIKLKFEDLMEFFEGIKDPAKLFESGLKALSAGTLAKLLLPATVSLLTSIIGNRILMGQFGSVLDSKLGGRVGSGPIVAPTGRGGRASRGRTNLPKPKATGFMARVAHGVSSLLSLGVKGGVGFVAAAAGFAEIALLGYAAYELYQIAKELGFSNDDASELSQYADEPRTEALSFSSSNTPEENKNKNRLMSERESNAELISKSTGNSQSEKNYRASLEQKQADIAKQLNEIGSKSRINEELEKAGKKQEIYDKFYYIWNELKTDEKLYAIEKGVPILETENFVYFMSEDRKTIKKKPVDEYLKELRALPEIEKMDREEFQRKLSGVIKPFESGTGGYNQPFAKDGKGNPFVPLPDGKTLTTMTGAEVLAYQQKQVEATKAAGIGIRNGKVVGTGAMGAYQFNQGNLADYYSKHESEKGQVFNEEQQDKIFRSLISSAVDEYMRTGDKITFEKYVVDTWEAFKPETSEARKQLKALLNNPVFTEGAGDTTKKQTKEQRAAREKVLMKMFGSDFSDVSSTNGDYRPVLVGNTDVAKEAVTVAKDTAGKMRDWLTDLIPDDSTLGSRAASFFGLNGDQSAGIQMDPGKKLGNYINYYNTDNRVTVASTSGGGGGGSAPSMSVNNVTNKPYFSYYQFMAGGSPAQ